MTPWNCDLQRVKKNKTCKLDECSALIRTDLQQNIKFYEVFSVKKRNPKEEKTQSHDARLTVPGWLILIILLRTSIPLSLLSVCKPTAHCPTTAEVLNQHSICCKRHFLLNFKVMEVKFLTKMLAIQFRSEMKAELR